jgi:hypothetical protein
MTKPGAGWSSRASAVRCTVDGRNATATLGGFQNDGFLKIRNASHQDALQFNAQNGTLSVGTQFVEGDIRVQDADGNEVFHLNGENATLIVGAQGNEGDIIVRDSTGADRIHLNGSDGDIKLLGADVAEDFAVAVPLAPGTVVVAVGADRVEPSAGCHDRRVVGVVAGAGDFQPALRLEGVVLLVGIPQVGLSQFGERLHRCDALPLREFSEGQIVLRWPWLCLFVERVHGDHLFHRRSDRATWAGRGGEADRRVGRCSHSADALGPSAGVGRQG